MKTARTVPRKALEQRIKALEDQNFRMRALLAAILDSEEDWDDLLDQIYVTLVRKDGQ